MAAQAWPAELGSASSRLPMPVPMKKSSSSAPAAPLTPEQKIKVTRLDLG
jgi:transposase